MNKAFQDVMAERRRQVEAEGWTPEHDDHHTDGELALAAVLYAIPYQMPGLKQADHIGLDMLLELGFGFKLKPEADYRKRLVKAAALLLAEIERLDRATARTIPPENDTPVRCPQCNWCGRADELGPEGECGTGGTCDGRPVEITEPADLIHAWWDSEGQVAGPQCIAAGLIEPHPATEKEAEELNIEVGDSVWDASEKGEAALRAAKAEA